MAGFTDFMETEQRRNVWVCFVVPFIQIANRKLLLLKIDCNFNFAQKGTVKPLYRSLQYLFRAAQLYFLQSSRFCEGSSPPDGVTDFIWASSLDVRIGKNRDS